MTVTTPLTYCFPTAVIIAVAVVPAAVMNQSRRPQLGAKYAPVLMGFIMRVPFSVPSLYSELLGSAVGNNGRRRALVLSVTLAFFFVL